MLDPPGSYWNCQPSSFASCFIIPFSFVSMCKSLGWYYTGQRCWLARVVSCLYRDCVIRHSSFQLTTVCREEFSGLQVMENIGWDTLDRDTSYVRGVCMRVSTCTSMCIICMHVVICGVFRVCGCLGSVDVVNMYIVMFRHGCAFVYASQKMVFSNQHLCFESSV